MLKRLLLVTVLTATSAFAQQNTDISGADFSSGKGDAALASAARKAAASGKRLVITAPQEWHKAIAAKLRAGGAVDVVLRDGFYESVLVRAEAKPEPEKAPVKSEAKAALATSPAAKPVVARPAVVAAPAIVPVAPSPAPAPPPPPVAQPPAAAVATAAKPAVKAATKPVPAVNTDAIYNRMQASLVGGRSAEGPLAVAALQAGDTIYVDEPVRGVIRRVAGRPYLYWLDGALDLRRSELKVVDKNRYQVMATIKGEASLRREFDPLTTTLLAREPAPNAPGRLVLERNLNEGRTIGRSLEVARLRSGDIVYTGKASAVVVHREGNDLQRFWLEGSLDLLQSGLQADGPGKYRVVSDSIR